MGKNWAAAFSCKILEAKNFVFFFKSNFYYFVSYLLSVINFLSVFQKMPIKKQAFYTQKKVFCTNESSHAKNSVRIFVYIPELEVNFQSFYCW
jgi:hypothetical protein